MAVAKNTLIVAELLKVFESLNDDFMAELNSHDDKVNNDTIKFNDIGADPDVLIDNTTYPITADPREDDSVVVSLRKLDTKNTKVTDDELFALAYDKKSSVRDRHAMALKRKTIELTLHSLAPSADGANTPVIQTTGEDDGNGRLRLLPKDLITLKERVDNLEIPLENRILVLNSSHVNDLLLTDQSFRDRYYNTATGKLIANISGFKIYENLQTPVFDATLAKKALGAAAATTDKKASVFFSTLNAMKARGSVKPHYRDAAVDPENRESVFGMRMYFIANPLSAKGIGAIVSGLGTT